MAVAAVVIAYQSEALVETCLASLAEMAPMADVLVVNNTPDQQPAGGAPDRTVALARACGARVLANPENRGFAGAVNQGFRATGAEHVLVLNPDITLMTPLGPMEEACRQSGLATGQLTTADGGPLPGWAVRRLPTAVVLSLELLGLNRLFPGNPWNRSYRWLDRDLSEAGPVEQPAGAFLMIRRDVWERLGGFDESFYPIWFEDVDFCRRAVDAGFRAAYVPEVRARHVGGQSIKTLDASSREVYWYDSLLRYAAKHFGSGQYRGVCLAAMLATVPRMVLGMIRQRSLKPISTGLYLLFLTGRRLVSRPATVQRSWRGTLTTKT